MNKKIFSWAMYDWANSVFYTTVMAGFFPVFFKKYWSGEDQAVLSTERLGWVLAVSGFLLAVFAPIMGVVSDKRRLKKKLLFVTMFVGVLCSMGLFFVGQGDWYWAAILYGVGLFMCSASCIFSDSLLVSVSRKDQLDFVSSLGYSLGYLGGGLLFSLNVIMFLKPQLFGIPDGSTAVRISFLTVGVWWFLFSLPLLFNVEEPNVAESSREVTFKKLIAETFTELKKTLFEIHKQKNIFFFVVAYWFYIDGVFTVMSMAVDFGLALGFESSDLIKALLITQFVGFPSAYLFGIWAKKLGSKLLIQLCLWVYLITIIAASQMSVAWHFYALAFIIGLSQGGVQALSRSLFASLIPAEKSGEYFGFFNLLAKFASVMGPLLIALCARYTEDSRKTILSLISLIIIGMFFLKKVKLEKSI